MVRGQPLPPLGAAGELEQGVGVGAGHGRFVVRHEGLCFGIKVCSAERRFVVRKQGLWFGSGWRAFGNGWRAFGGKVYGSETVGGRSEAKVCASEVPGDASEAVGGCSERKVYGPEAVGGHGEAAGGAGDGGGRLLGAVIPEGCHNGETTYFKKITYFANSA